MSDAKIIKVETVGQNLVLELDCSWTALHPERHVDRLILEHCTALNPPDLAGMFWHRAQISGQQGKFELCLVVSDEKNHKRTVSFTFSSALYERKLAQL